jgi:hypothetical protein
MQKKLNFLIVVRFWLYVLGATRCIKRVVEAYGLENLFLPTNNLPMHQKLNGMDLFTCVYCASQFTEAEMVSSECLYHSCSVKLHSISY